MSPLEPLCAALAGWAAYLMLRVVFALAHEEEERP